MAVDPAIETFSFALFRKLWIRNGLSDCTEMVPDYPAVPNSACPDDFCDAVHAVQCLSSSFYEELCEEDCILFAHSRSDFLKYLGYIMAELRKVNVSFQITTLSLAAAVAEMGLACARRGSRMFVFSCPLSFAMVFEDFFSCYLKSCDPRFLWERVLCIGAEHQHVRLLGDIVGRSKSLRRGLVYRLQLLRTELRLCPDGLQTWLARAVRFGGFLDHPSRPNRFSAALFFPLCLEIIHQTYLVYLKPLYAENFIGRNDFLRKYFFQDIARLCEMDEESEEAFCTLYETSVFGELADIPPESAVTRYFSHFPEPHNSDDLDPYNQDVTLRTEEHSRIISDAPPLNELYCRDPLDQDLYASHPVCRSSDNTNYTSSGNEIGITDSPKLPIDSARKLSSSTFESSPSKIFQPTPLDSRLVTSKPSIPNYPYNLIVATDSEGLENSHEIFESTSQNNLNFSGEGPSAFSVVTPRSFVMNNGYGDNSSRSLEHREPQISDGIHAAEVKDCQNDVIFSTIDNSIYDSAEAHADFETSKGKSSLSSLKSVDRNEKTLDSCQSSVFAIFAEEYLELEKTSFGDSDTLKINDRGVIEKNCQQREEIFKTPVSSKPYPFQIKGMHTVEPPVEDFSQNESSPETSSNSSADSICTVVSIETHCSKIARNIENDFLLESQSESPRESVNIPLELPTTKANSQNVGEISQDRESLRKEVNSPRELKAGELNPECTDNKNDRCKYQSDTIPSSPKSYERNEKLVTRGKTDSDSKQKKAYNPRKQKSHTKVQEQNSSLTGGDFHKLMEGMPSSVTEDEDKKSKKGSKKRKNRLKKKNKQDTGKQTEDSNNEGKSPEKSGIIELNVYQMILIMGVPFEKPLKSLKDDNSFMDRINYHLTPVFSKPVVIGSQTSNWQFKMEN